MVNRPVEYNSSDNVNENVSKINPETNLTGTSNDRPATYDDTISIRGDLFFIDIPSTLFVVSDNTIIPPIDLSSVLYNGLLVKFRQRQICSFDNSGLEYNYPYYVKLIDNRISLYYDKNLTNKVVFINGGTGNHTLEFRVNLYKFDSSLLLPYNNRIQELNKQFTDIFNFLIQLESENPDSFEKVLQSITNKYIDYFDLSDDIIYELISESGYDYIIDLDLNLGTSELSTFYSYLKLIHLMKDTRPGLEFVLQLLGYESKIVEWWEMPNVTGLSYGDSNTFDLVIKLVNQPTLTTNQIAKIRKFVRFYVYPVLRYIVQDILSEFGSIGLGVGGLVDNLFEFDTTAGTLVVSGGGFNNSVYQSASPNANVVVPYKFDNADGESGFLSLGQEFHYLVLNSNTTQSIIIYLTNASVVGNVGFSLKKNGVQIISQMYLTLATGQNLLNYSSTISTVKGDVLTLTVENLNILDTSVGDSIIWGLSN